MENMHEARKQLSEFLDKINTYVKKPIRNQPDAFLLGIMKAPKGKYTSEKEVLHLSEDTIIPEDFLPEVVH